MTKAEVLAKVKLALGNVPSHLDETLKLYLEEVCNYLISAGVKVIDLEADSIDARAVGCITRGVADLWNYGNGDTKLSEYFYQRADQLRSLENE